MRIFGGGRPQNDDLSVDGVQIVEMARKACISYEDVEKMAEHFSLEIAKEVNKDIRRLRF